MTRIKIYLLQYKKKMLLTYMHILSHKKLYPDRHLNDTAEKLKRLPFLLTYSYNTIFWHRYITNNQTKRRNSNNIKYNIYLRTVHEPTYKVHVSLRFQQQLLQYIISELINVNTQHEVQAYQIITHVGINESVYTFGNSENAFDRKHVKFR